MTLLLIVGAVVVVVGLLVVVTGFGLVRPWH